MSNFLFAVKTVAPIFIYIALGYILKRSVFTNHDRIAAVNKLCANILLPITLFNSAMRANYSDPAATHTSVFCIVVTLVFIALLFLIIPRIVKDHPSAKSVIQGGFRGNLMVVSVALMANMYGEEGSGITSVVSASLVAVYNILGTLILSDYRTDGKLTAKSLLHIIWKALTMPLLLGAAFGIAFALLGITLPPVLDGPVRNLAVSGSALSLIVLGAQFDLKKAISEIRLSTLSVAVKVILLPLTGVIAGWLMGFRGVEIACIFAILGAPASTNSAVIAESLGCNGRLSGDIVVLSNITFLFTSFLSIALLRSIGWI